MLLQRMQRKGPWPQAGRPGTELNFVVEAIKGELEQEGWKGAWTILLEFIYPSLTQTHRKRQGRAACPNRCPFAVRVAHSWCGVVQGSLPCEADLALSGLQSAHDDSRTASLWKYFRLT